MDKRWRLEIEDTDGLLRFKGWFPTEAEAKAEWYRLSTQAGRALLCRITDNPKL